mgnify:CR=1 FL=1
MSTYALSPEAEEDLDEIWGYVYDQNNFVERADAAIRKLYAAFAELAAMPSMGRHPDKYGPGTYIFPKGSYLIVFRPTEDGVEIVRVTGADPDLVDGW